MPWNKTTRMDYKLDGRHYESDETDQEWAIVEAMLPKPPSCPYSTYKYFHQKFGIARLVDGKQKK